MTILCYYWFNSSFFFIPEITVPAFVGQSYLTFLFPTFSSSSLSAMLYLRTLRATGFIYFTAINSVFVSVSVKNSSVLLSYDLGEGIESIRASFLTVDDGSWHYINFTILSTMACIQVDSSQFCRQSSDMLVSSLQGAVVHIGGVPDYSSLPIALNQTTGFVGCIDSLLLNSHPINLVQGSIAGDGITQCAMGACSIDSCQKNGICAENEATMLGYTCYCDLGYAGDTCADGKEVYIHYI